MALKAGRFGAEEQGIIMLSQSCAPSPVLRRSLVLVLLVLLPGIARAVEPVAGSLWTLGGDWQQDNGRPLALSELAGAPAVVAMFYTGCHASCPVTVEAMQWVEHNLPSDLSRRCRFVLVTLDPGGDTPEELRAFRLEHGLSDRWTLLRGTRRQTREFADRIGLTFEVGAYRTTHTTRLAVLGADGKIIAVHRQLYPELKILVGEVERLNL